ncbi:MAG: hypothetical protein O7E54_02645 [Planctomycetota bacterium]|jgi:hypothetical protein|nr:hypothetical protein [Planctomycetota bacterium]
MKNFVLGERAENIIGLPVLGDQRRDLVAEVDETERGNRDRISSEKQGE